MSVPSHCPSHVPTLYDIRWVPHQKKVFSSRLKLIFVFNSCVSTRNRKRWSSNEVSSERLSSPLNQPSHPFYSLQSTMQVIRACHQASLSMNLSGTRTAKVGPYEKLRYRPSQLSTTSPFRHGIARSDRSFSQFIGPKQQIIHLREKSLSW